MKRLAIALLMFWVSAVPAKLWGPYDAQYVKNYDGDTATFVVHIFYDEFQPMQVRVVGIDNPEIRGKCRAEKHLALQAKEKAREILTSVEYVLVVVHHGEDNFGRPLVTIDVDGEDFGELMIEEGLAKPWDYNREPKPKWCGVRM